jgi:hypothetical protein
VCINYYNLINLNIFDFMSQQLRHSSQYDSLFYKVVKAYLCYRQLFLVYRNAEQSKHAQIETHTYFNTYKYIFNKNSKPRHKCSGCDHLAMNSTECKKDSASFQNSNCVRNERCLVLGRLLSNPLHPSNAGTHWHPEMDVNVVRREYL